MTPDELSVSALSDNAAHIEIDKPENISDIIGKCELKTYHKSSANMGIGYSIKDENEQ